MKVRIFNGYVENPFNAQHQTPKQMLEWGEKIHEAVPGTLTFTGYQLEQCWAFDMINRIEHDTGRFVYSSDYPNSPTDRYPTAGDALRSQILLCQRFEWLSHAAALYPHVDIWAWVEYTIFKQRGITVPIVQQFVEDIARYPVDAISLPGMLPKVPVVDHINHWRFAGSAWVCPAKYASTVCDTMKKLITLRTTLTHRLCWDNSSWSYLELLNVLPMRWYPGNHDETQLTGYKIGVDEWPRLSAN